MVLETPLLQQLSGTGETLYYDSLVVLETPLLQQLSGTGDPSIMTA